jgi:NitT/TauT family transport system permease protein
VPASILFWPTQDLSIGFVIFLGGFFTIALNVIGGIKAIDERYFQAARSMGGSSMGILRSVALPGVLPSILVGAVVGMGISWEVVIAGELISGGGSAVGGSGGGIGFFIWNSYVTAGDGAESKIIVGMFSIGIMGYVSCEIIRALGRALTPWLRGR